MAIPKHRADAILPKWSLSEPIPAERRDGGLAPDCRYADVFLESKVEGCCRNARWNRLLVAREAACISGKVSQ